MTTRSAAPATSTLEPPRTDTWTPAAAAPARAATSVATCSARSASRDPSSTRCPAAASRTASPRPCGPVPPSTPTTRSSTARPSVTSPPVAAGAPAARPPGGSCPGAPAAADRVGSALALVPGAVLGVGLLVALGDLLQRVLGLRPGRERAEPVALGAPVPGLDGVVLQAEEERPLVQRRSPLTCACEPALSLAPRGPSALLRRAPGATSRLRSGYGRAQRGFCTGCA